VALAPGAPPEAEWAIALAEVRRTVRPDGTVEVTTRLRTWDKLRALVALGKIQGLFDKGYAQGEAQSQLQVTLTDLFKARERARAALAAEEAQAAAAGGTPTERPALPAGVNGAG
jgi:hypothetical protein